MKKFLALGLLAAFFLAPSVQAQVWHGARGGGYQQHRPGGGYYNYHRPQQLQQLKWRNRYYWGGNRLNQSGWQQWQSTWGRNDYPQRWYENQQLHRDEIWGSQPIGPGYYHRPGRHFNDDCYR